MSRRLLIINQALNLSFLKIIEELASEFGECILITGSYLDSEREQLRIMHAPPHNPTTIISRLKSWIQFILFVLNSVRKNRLSFDLVFVTTNPPIAPFLAFFFKKIKNWPYILLVWDIYPDIIEGSDRFKVFKPLFVLWRWLNGKVYKNAYVVITIGEKMALTIRKQIPRLQFDIKIIPNCSDPIHIRPIPKEENWFAQRYNLTDKFVVLYSGKMGLSHDIETILKAAKLLASYEDIIFLFIGQGPGYNFIQEFIKRESLPNILLLPLQSDEVFPFSIAVGDIGIVSIQKGMENLMMPSKLYDMMAAGLAIIGISNGENDLRDTIERYNIGINEPSGDWENLVKDIIFLKNNPEILSLYKRNSREALIKYFQISEIYKMFKKQFDAFGEKNLGEDGN